MTIDDLAEKLAEMYDRKDKVLSIHLFGIKYAKELEECGCIREIRDKAMNRLGVNVRGKSTYINYINHGIKLARHVKNNKIA